MLSLTRTIYNGAQPAVTFNFCHMINDFTPELQTSQKAMTASDEKKGGYEETSMTSVFSRRISPNPEARKKQSIAGFRKQPCLVCESARGQSK